MSNAFSRSNGLQRFFSTFPADWPGMGLLLLRAVAGAVAAIQGSLYLTNVAEPTALSWAVGVLVIVSAIGLIAGFMTPGAAMGVGVATLFIAATWIPPAPESLLVDRVAGLLVIVDAVALAVLGPGAYSVDAYLFGRREIIIPDDRLYPGT